MTSAKIMYTQTDEAPALAVHAFLPIVKAFTQTADIDIETKDISLASRILANFSDYLSEEQQTTNALNELGNLAKTPEANIIKLPNISASIPQLNAAIKELQDQGYALPDYPKSATNATNKAIQQRYSVVLGSAVNPILREGNSDRRVASSVKQYAQNNPHSMGAWSADSKSHVASMTDGDFYSSEQSVVMESENTVSIQLTNQQGETIILKENIDLQTGEVIDSTVMSTSALCAFYEQSMQEAKADDILLSLHLKATMMKASDPIMFGHAVTVYYQDVFDKHAKLFAKLGIDANNGIGDVYQKISQLDSDTKAEIEADIEAVYTTRPALAMVDSDKGITNLHVPSNVIVDASMPAAIRSSGKMWGPDGKLKDTKAIIPDRNYSGVYQATIDFCKEHGAFDVTTMGNIANVGLMAQKAEEYGSHDKTFQITESGQVSVIDNAGNTLMQHTVEQGDIWRMCQTKDAPIKDWVKLAVNRARATGVPAIFWLDPQRAHDSHLIDKATAYLEEHDTSELDIQIMSPIEATHYSLERIQAGKDTISVTGNVLRDYLTDLFPILELGTSAKMLSIVPLLAGGGLFETGAGGSAPKHVQQFLAENHLRWDSLGEYLALAVSLEDLATKTDNSKAQVLADCLNEANSQYLNQNKSPSRKTGELDNRGSSFYLTLYWAQALATQTIDDELQQRFAPLAEQLASNEKKIMGEMNEVQGKTVDIEGYYHPNTKLVEIALRPSETFNTLLETLS